jgi:hypothetical protein
LLHPTPPLAAPQLTANLRGKPRKKPEECWKHLAESPGKADGTRNLRAPEAWNWWKVLEKSGTIEIRWSSP